MSFYKIIQKVIILLKCLKKLLILYFLFKIHLLHCRPNALNTKKIQSIIQIFFNFYLAHLTQSSKIYQNNSIQKMQVNKKLNKKIKNSQKFKRKKTKVSKFKKNNKFQFYRKSNNYRNKRQSKKNKMKFKNKAKFNYSSNNKFN